MVEMPQGYLQGYLLCSRSTAVGVFLETAHTGVPPERRGPGHWERLRRSEKGRVARPGPRDDPGDSGQQRKGSAGALCTYEVVDPLPKISGKESPNTSDSTKVIYFWKFSEIQGLAQITPLFISKS